MLIISIEELEKAPEGQLILEFNEKIKDLETREPVTGELTVSLTAFGVEVEGYIEADIILECVRCMASFPYHLDVNIDEKYIKDSLSFGEAKEIELKGENFVEELMGKDQIDLTDLVYQSIILNMPTKMLCKEECKGSDDLQKLQTEKPLDPRMEVFKNISVKKD